MDDVLAPFRAHGAIGFWNISAAHREQVAIVWRPDLGAQILWFSMERMARFERPRILGFRTLPGTATGKHSRSVPRGELLARPADDSGPAAR
jgi:hypothetical protein